LPLVLVCVVGESVCVHKGGKSVGTQTFGRWAARFSATQILAADISKAASFPVRAQSPFQFATKVWGRWCRYQRSRVRTTFCGRSDILTLGAGTARENRVAAHSHIRGLGLREDGSADQSAAGFIGQQQAREVSPNSTLFPVF
jgi:hypothetical protein